MTSPLRIALIILVLTIAYKAWGIWDVFTTAAFVGAAFLAITQSGPHSRIAAVRRMWLRLLRKDGTA